MANDPLLSARAADAIRSIRQRIERPGSYSSSSYERDVTRLVNTLFPFSVLPGVRLFSTEPRGRIPYGFEMDNLVHLRLSGIDYLLIIEAKNQKVQVDKGKWMVTYDGQQKCAREQLDNHIRTIWEYLEPIARNTDLKFIGVVASSDAATARQKVDGFHNAELYLCGIISLPDLFVERFNFGRRSGQPEPEVLRVCQSAFLDLLRLSLPVEQLGHPELASAIKYVERCRRTLDGSVFQLFKPKPQRWMINGAAGMGKSVLLAYAAAVLSSGYELYRSLGEIGAKKATETFEAMRFDADPKRGAIGIMAMSAKQLESIKGWFNFFVEEFQAADQEGLIRFRPPEFILCRAGGRLSGRHWAALLVDEAHDLPLFAAREIAELYNKGDLYLVVACDRHQKLRLAGSSPKVIEGLDFGGKGTWLKQPYRNPAPTYIASLALMFRWFAEEGPKVIPTVKEMQDQFGFEAKTGAGSSLEVTMRSDAHPANSWCHTVATFPDANSAHTALAKEKVGHKEVLWVRFSEEDPDFDYEQLNRNFTYHNCRSRDAHKISDKYIKGQDYPIVVIEGFPGFMDRFEASEGETKEAAETRMWSFRRELYLCASRATTFLYLICNVQETKEVLRIKDEIRRLVAATAMPENPDFRGTKSWKFVVRRTSQTRNTEVFADIAEETVTKTKEKPIAPPRERVAAPKKPSIQEQKVVDLISGTETRKPMLPPVRKFPAEAVHSPAPVSLQKDGKKLIPPTPVSKVAEEPPKPVQIPTLKVPAQPTVRDLATLLGVKPSVLIKELLERNIFATPNQTVEWKDVFKLCRKHGFVAELEQAESKPEVAI